MINEERQTPDASDVQNWFERKQGRPPAALLFGRVDRFLSKSGTPLLAVAMLPLLALSLASASVRPLWNDELFTYKIASLTSLAEVWKALAAGGEQVPFFYYFIVWNCLKVLGTSELTVRLPSFVGFLIGLLSIFFFLRGAVGSSYAAIGAMLPMTTIYSRFLYEGRPYGVILGFAGLALCSWKAANRSRWRRAALACLAFSLFVLPGIHYFSVLVIFPLVIGEFCRARTPRSVDVLPIAIIVAAPAVGLILNSPLMLTAAENAGTFWASRGSIREAFWLIHSVFENSWSVPIVCMSWLIPLALRFQLRHPATEKIEGGAPLSGPEWAVVMGFALLPLVGLAATFMVDGAFVDRYFIPMVLGTSISTAAFLAICFRPIRGNGAFAVASALSLVAFLTYAGWASLQGARGEGRALSATIKMLESYPDASLPIATAESQTFLELSHYATPAVRSKLVYLGDLGLAKRWLGFTSMESGMYSLVGPWFGTNVVNYREFVVEHAHFLLFGNLDSVDSWVDKQLRSDGWALDFRGAQPGKILFEVRRGAPPKPE